MTRPRSHPIHAGSQGSLAFGPAAACDFALAPSVGRSGHLPGGGIGRACRQDPQRVPSLRRIALPEQRKLADAVTARELLRSLMLAIPPRRRMQP